MKSVHKRFIISQFYRNLTACLIYDDETDTYGVVIDGEYKKIAKVGFKWDGIILKNGTIGKDVSFSGGSGGLIISTGSYYALEPINTENWHYLHIKVTDVSVNGTSAWGAVGLYTKTAGNYHPSGGLQAIGVNTIQKAGDWVLDISSVQGTFYAGFYMSSGSMRITDFWLE